MKWALITFGNEESYGMLFVGGELLQHAQEIRFFDGEAEDCLLEAAEWEPDFVCFSPMTTFYRRALTAANSLRIALPGVKAVFGGHHAMSAPEQVIADGVDVVVVGPVRGSIRRIVAGEEGIIQTDLTSPADLPRPARAECYVDIPRLGARYRKFVMSVLGCPWSCSYCSSGCRNRSRIFGAGHKDYYLRHRPLEDVMEELHEATSYPTLEIEWVDDDVFAGDERWLLDFMTQYKKRVGLPMYVSTTSLSVIRASAKLLGAFSEITSAVGLGVQAARAESLRIFNRKWDSEERMKEAYNRLESFGYSVNLQAIVGLPVSDPVEDAIETVKLLQRIGAGSIASIYPLEVYPGTELERYCMESGYTINHQGSGDTNTGEGGIVFHQTVIDRLRNICKLGTMFVKYNVDEKWMRALLDIDFPDSCSKELSLARYRDCVEDRIGDGAFEEIMRTTKLRY